MTVMENAPHKEATISHLLIPPPPLTKVLFSPELFKLNECVFRIYNSESQYCIIDWQGNFADVPALLSSQDGKENERRGRLKRETRVIAVGKCRKNFRVLKHVQINRAIKQNDNFRKYCQAQKLKSAILKSNSATVAEKQTHKQTKYSLPGEGGMGGTVIRSIL